MAIVGGELDVGAIVTMDPLQRHAHANERPLWLPAAAIVVFGSFLFERTTTQAIRF